MNLKSIVKTGIMWVGSWFKRNRGSKILYYHDVFKTTNYRALNADIFMGTPLDLFIQHVRVIRSEGYEIVRKITKPEGQVALMFDDGFRGIWECREFFFDHGLCPTIFLPVEYIGRKDLGMLSLDEIKELQRYGFIFQSHTWTHRPLTSVPEEELRKELVDSKNKLSEMLDAKVSALCMPLGFFTTSLLRNIKDAGYVEIYSCIPGNVTDGPYGLISRNLVQHASPLQLKLILRGANEIIKKRYIKQHCKDKKTINQY